MFRANAGLDRAPASDPARRNPPGEMRILFAVAGFTLFVVILLQVTLRSTRTPLQQPDADREAAQRTCRMLVRDRIPDARFPAAASVEAHGAERLRLSGSVDEGATRRNYQCLLRRDRSGAYVPDSVVVWQSH